MISVSYITYFGFLMQAFIKILLLSFCLAQAANAEKPIILTALSLDQATKNIIDSKKSKVLGAKTEVIQGKKVHVIKVLTKNGHVQYLKVDAESGKIIK